MPSTKLIDYRCVCGATVQVEPDRGGTCEKCDRAYTANAVNASMSMTIGMPSDVAIEPVEPEDDEMLGRALDHFTIIDRVGGGGMGTVYRALDESLQRYVALKVIRRDRPTGGSSGTLQFDRLLQEARAQARVNHPHVVHIYFVSRDETMPYLAMELVGGRSLATKLEEGPMPYAEVVRIGLQIADALRESAQFDIVHGDIKPANILMQEGNAKLSDFGLAQRISRQTEDDAKVAGTPNYMAPEVCRGELADTRSDQYSFGVMLFEMTFGRLPYTFPDSTLETRFKAHQHSPIEFPTPWREVVPDSWRQVLQRLLSKSPDDRYDSYDELVTELKAHRPIAPIPAGRLVRGIAWAIDLVIMLLIQTAILVTLAFVDTLFVVPRLIMIAGGLIAPTFALVWQSRGGRSPGKQILQLRVVDEYGLLPSARRLAWRSVFQLLPAWVGPWTLDLGDTVFRSGWLAVGAAVCGVALIADACTAFFTIDMRSIHDRIFKTRVVLDTPETAEVAR